MENLMNEEWKDIEGFEGMYKISNRGRVKSVGRSRPGRRPVGEGILKPNGCYSVKLSNNNEHVNVLIKKLVARAFIPNPYNYPEVHQIDRNKENCNYENLVWVPTVITASSVVIQQISIQENIVLGEYWSRACACILNQIDYNTMVGLLNGSIKHYMGYIWKEKVGKQIVEIDPEKNEKIKSIIKPVQEKFKNRIINVGFTNKKDEKEVSGYSDDDLEKILRQSLSNVIDKFNITVENKNDFINKEVYKHVQHHNEKAILDPCPLCGKNLPTIKVIENGRAKFRTECKCGFGIIKPFNSLEELEKRCNNRNKE